MALTNTDKKEIEVIARREIKNFMTKPQFKNEVQKYKDGLVEAINQQFKIWGLTESEADVALLLVKGLSMKDIAKIRGTSEATVRQQSSSIYHKSNLENRNQLTSYFLEDLF